MLGIYKLINIQHHEFIFPRLAWSPLKKFDGMYSYIKQIYLERIKNCFRISFSLYLSLFLSSSRSLVATEYFHGGRLDGKCGNCLIAPLVCSLHRFSLFNVPMATCTARSIFMWDSDENTKKAEEEYTWCNETPEARRRRRRRRRHHHHDRNRNCTKWQESSFSLHLVAAS